MPKKKATQQRKSVPRSKILSPSPNSADDATNQCAEKAFWWAVYERRDFLKRELRIWENNDTNHLTENKKQLAALRKLLDEIESLIDQSKPKELMRLQHWHSGLTEKQRESWAHSMESLPRPAQRHHFLSPLIEKGIAETDGSRSALYTWMKEQALDETPPLTGIDDNGAILYASRTNKQKRFTVNALGKHLGNLRKHRQ